MFSLLSCGGRSRLEPQTHLSLRRSPGSVSVRPMPGRSRGRSRDPMPRHNLASRSSSLTDQLTSNRWQIKKLGERGTSRSHRKEFRSVRPIVHMEKPRYIQFVMLRRMNSMNTITATRWMTASTCVILFLCVCVLAQMLGMPITFFSLVSSADVFLESVSEDFSFPPTVPTPRTSNARISYSELQASPYLPVFVTSVFHPPQA